MITKPSSNSKRKMRHRRVRKKVFGTPDCPRLNIYRSSKNIYAQIIDDTNGVTLAAASSLDNEIKEKASNTGNREAAKLVGILIGKKATEKGVQKVVFDRGGYLYHGRVRELAEGARESGLQF